MAITHRRAKLAALVAAGFAAFTLTGCAAPLDESVPALISEHIPGAASVEVWEGPIASPGAIDLYVSFELDRELRPEDVAAVVLVVAEAEPQRALGEPSIHRLSVRAMDTEGECIDMRSPIEAAGLPEHTAMELRGEDCGHLSAPWRELREWAGQL